MTEPVADRPQMPDGYLGGPPLPWQWALEQLVDARNYWVTTIGVRGRPHVRPVWGIWRDDTFQFSTGAQHAENIARDPRVTVNLDSGDDCVIIEGTGAATTDPAARLSFVEEYREKYDFPVTMEFVDTLYVVRPDVVLGWLAYDIARGATLFTATATRWRFNPA